MRKALLALGLVAAVLLAAVAGVYRDIPLPPIGPAVEPVCAETMRRSTPDLSWVAPDREERVRGREVKTVTSGELPWHSGELVRAAGVLHVEYEWVALYPSRAALQERWHAPWVALGSLWRDEPYWRTKGPSISDRCVVVEGIFEGGRGGHFGMFNGTIRTVLRLDVWSMPHRPLIGAPGRRLDESPKYLNQSKD